MAGRPSKPTQLKILHGDKRDRINTAEPQPAQGQIVQPRQLTPEAQEVWDRLAPDLIAKGVLTPWDTDAFASFCEAVALNAEMTRLIARREVDSAVVQLYGQSSRTMASLGGRFGLTPSDRSKLKVGEAEKDDRERLLS